jgi:hypothetical protein
MQPMLQFNNIYRTFIEHDLDLEFHFKHALRRLGIGVPFFLASILPSLSLDHHDTLVSQEIQASSKRG